MLLIGVHVDKSDLVQKATSENLF